MKFEWEYELEIDELEQALYGACNLIAQISMEHDECLLKNQKFCRDCPIEDCEEPFKWFNYFLENARHPPE